MIDELLDALHEYQMAKSEYDSAKSGYHGYSWDYHGYNLREAMDKAKDKAETAINEIISDRIRETVHVTGIKLKDTP